MPPPEKLEALSSVLSFNPHWFADPPPWWIFEVFEEDQRAAVATVQLQHVQDTLAAHMRAVEGFQKILGAQR